MNESTTKLAPVLERDMEDADVVLSPAGPTYGIPSRAYTKPGDAFSLTANKHP